MIQKRILKVFLSSFTSKRSADFVWLGNDGFSKNWHGICSVSVYESLALGNLAKGFTVQESPDLFDNSGNESLKDEENFTQ